MGNAAVVCMIGVRVSTAILKKFTNQIQSAAALKPVDPQRGHILDFLGPTVLDIMGLIPQSIVLRLLL